MNGSYAPELTELLKEIIEEIAKNIIKEGQPIILIDEYSWYREVLSLMAKQVNLCDSFWKTEWNKKHIFWQGVSLIIHCGLNICVKLMRERTQN